MGRARDEEQHDAVIDGLSLRQSRVLRSDGVWDKVALLYGDGDEGFLKPRTIVEAKEACGEKTWALLSPEDKRLVVAGHSPPTSMVPLESPSPEQEAEPEEGEGVDPLVEALEAEDAAEGQRWCASHPWCKGLEGKAHKRHLLERIEAVSLNHVEPALSRAPPTDEGLAVGACVPVPDSEEPDPRLGHPCAPSHDSSCVQACLTTLRGVWRSAQPSLAS